MITNFKELGIIPPILEALDEMGFEAPTEVQSRAIPHILNKEDLIVMSKTGSGKTAVFGVSMLQMTDPEAPGPQGLVLTPARELAVQVDSDLKKMSGHLKHKTAAVYGQHNINTEIEALKKGISIVTGTPGRVFDHIQHRNLVTKNIRFLVLDEADRMLDMGFLDQVVRIIRTLPKDRITLLFSATMPSEIRRICAEYMKQPVMVEIESKTKTVESIHQEYYRIDDRAKNTHLNNILMLERPESCMIFCNTKIAVDRVQNFLEKKGYASHALHGDIPQSKRLNTINKFKNGDYHLLVATDVAARGIHIEDLSLVINYDVPNDKDNYVHRIGRTGRAGNDGRAITLVTSDDIMSLYEIEEHIGALIPESELPSEADLKEHTAEIDEWIKANASKEKPSAANPRHHKKEDQTVGNRRKTGQSKGSKAKAASTGKSSPGNLSTGKTSQEDAPRENVSRGKASQAKSAKPARTDKYHKNTGVSGTEKVAVSAVLPAKTGIKTSAAANAPQTENKNKNADKALNNAGTGAGSGSKHTIHRRTTGNRDVGAAAEPASAAKTGRTDAGRPEATVAASKAKTKTPFLKRLVKNLFGK